jgi:hypothetical protein
MKSEVKVGLNNVPMKFAECYGTTRFTQSRSNISNSSSCYGAALPTLMDLGEKLVYTLEEAGFWHDFLGVPE